MRKAASADIGDGARPSKIQCRRSFNMTFTLTVADNSPFDTVFLFRFIVPFVIR